MPNRLPTYVRTHRRSWGFSQRELAALVGVSTQVISQYEQLERTPGHRVLIALAFVFDVTAHELFPASGYSAIRAVLEKAVPLREALAMKSDAISRRKRQLLDNLITRSAELLAIHEP